MNTVAPETGRLRFITQLPRQDGCGAVVVQMLTGRSYDEIVGIIGWPEGAVHYSSWKEIRHALSTLGWSFGEPQACTSWAAVRGLAVAHVRDDHFMLYDADNGLFYDPGEPEGPSPTSDRIPMSYMTVTPPPSR